MERNNYVFSYVVTLLRSGLKKRDLQPQQEPHYPHWLCTLIHLFICSFPQEMGTKMQVSGQLHFH